MRLEDLHLSPCYMSVAVDMELLAAAGDSEAMPDWRITLSPPLTINNMLPVPADYTVFELPRAGVHPCLLAVQTRCSRRLGAVLLHLQAASVVDFEVCGCATVQGSACVP